VSAAGPCADEREAALAPPRAAAPLGRGSIRHAPGEFEVVEIPARAPAGEGSHLWLELEREGMSTDHAAATLARCTGVARREVGFAGLKDRHARTRQWFSVPAPADAAAVEAALAAAGLRVLARGLDRRKLRRGALAGNRFRILVRGSALDATAIECALARIARHGVPNYFGPQRFGHDAGNLGQARAMLCAGVRVRDRHRRGLYLSAARSLLFNRVLAARVRAASWCRLLPGEVVSLAGSASYFVADTLDETLRERLARLDLHPSGPLWGRGGSPARGEAARVEAAALGTEQALMAGLERAGVEQARRALRLAITEPALEAVPGIGVRLSFALPPGGYATVVLRELLEVEDCSAP